MNIHEELAALINKHYEETGQWIERADFRQMQGSTSEGRRANAVVQVTLIKCATRCGLTTWRTYQVDIGTAQALGRTEADALRVRIV